MIHRIAIPFVFLVALCGASSQAADRPNILFAISDDQSFPHASAYGYSAVNTPAFDRVAREGMLFTAAIAPSPGCSPCRAAILTGRYPWQLEHAGTHASSFPKEYVVYPDLLETAGYWVGYTGKGWGPGNFAASGRKRNPAGPAFQKRKLKSPPGIRNTDYAANFADFLEQRPNGQPFCFWYGGSEPHRTFKKGIGLEQGKNLADVVVPDFLPDVPEVRSDILDYCVEIEWFDKHLGQMIAALEKAGELENTIIVVTSDNGMAFPRAKANTYEYGIHMPLAIRWGAQVKGGQTSDALVSLTDLAPTFLNAANVEHPAAPDSRLAMAGNDLLPLLAGHKSKRPMPRRNAVYSARERHSSSRWNNLAYPQRCIRTAEFLYIRNFRPDRWPAGAPQKFHGDKLGPAHGGYHDIDACPTLSYLIDHRDDPKVSRYFHLAVDKRPAEELYNISQDPGCLKNLAGTSDAADTQQRLSDQLETYLRATGDPRVLDGGEIFETYRRYSPIRKFPKPE